MSAPLSIDLTCPHCGRFVVYTLEDGEVDGHTDCPHCDGDLNQLHTIASERLADMAEDA